MTPPATLLLFARAPAPGRVKTRLAAALGEAGALALYVGFLEDAARAYLAPSRWSAVLETEGDPDEPVLAELFGPPWRRVRQADGDLGERLTRAFRREFGAGARAAIAVGSDHPALTRERIAELLEALADGSDAALVPAEDGGYCAIALAARVDAAVLFRGISWSSAAVLDETTERARAAGLRLSLLSPAYDVDRPEDVARLAKDLAARDPADPGFPRATAAALAALSAAGRR